jgi:hypothetical protein
LRSERVEQVLQFKDISNNFFSSLISVACEAAILQISRQASKFGNPVLQARGSTILAMIVSKLNPCSAGLQSGQGYSILPNMLLTYFDIFPLPPQVLHLSLIIVTPFTDVRNCTGGKIADYSFNPAGIGIIRAWHR